MLEDKSFEALHDHRRQCHRSVVVEIMFIFGTGMMGAAFRQDGTLVDCKI